MQNNYEKMLKNCVEEINLYYNGVLSSMKKCLFFSYVIFFYISASYYQILWIKFLFLLNKYIYVSCDYNCFLHYLYLFEQIYIRLMNSYLCRKIISLQTQQIWSGQPIHYCLFPQKDENSLIVTVICACDSFYIVYLLCQYFKFH